MMKLHSPDVPVVSSRLLPNRFLFGDALDAQDLEPCEYVVHTESPAFICRLVGNDETPFDGCDQRGFASALLFDDEEQATIYVCNPGFRLYDFTFSEEVPTAAELKVICDAAMVVYLQLQEIYRERESDSNPREVRVIASRPLDMLARAAAVSELMSKVCEASEQPEKRPQLTALVQQTLSGDDSAVLTEVQHALQQQPEARTLLLKSARDCIAYPEVLHKDGTISKFDLWGLPFVFSRAQGGTWWHFPLLERIEPLLAQALECPADSVLWVSPTVFTLEMLQERGCQDLIHLAAVMDAGCDYAQQDLLTARATYEAARQAREPQLQVAFIPFLVERGAVAADQARRLGRKVLEAVRPLVQDAIGAEMEYGEAELYSPLPWWDAVSSGIGGMNRKRLGLTLAMVAGQRGGLHGLEAEAAYQPELQGYLVIVRQAASQIEVARALWLLVADIAPDRERAWADLAACMLEAGIKLTEQRSRLH
jgi:hypothetical protein